MFTYIHTNGKHRLSRYIFSRIFLNSTLYFESHSGSYAGLSEGQGGCTDEDGCRVEEVEVMEAEIHPFPAVLRPHHVKR